MLVCPDDNPQTLNASNQRILNAGLYLKLKTPFLPKKLLAKAIEQRAGHRDYCAFNHSAPMKRKVMFSYRSCG